ncbi:MAG: hypothetical protein KGJ87_09895 [Planctomycetota bacterium]|nr:hypothetical protein [Planctomycetota bacterium]MDE2217454.1 hypothetical protein [Planctomycetota bacterium]
MKRFKSAALEAVKYERSVFSEEQGRWPDFRSGRNLYSACQWCHGATGIGFARIGMRDTDDHSVISGEIEIAIARTLEVPMERLDHLCCGNFGRLDFLFSAGCFLGDESLVGVSLRRASEILHHVEAGRGFVWRLGSDRYNPGLFTGIAGVGYQLLRLTHPNDLPSVLLWETNSTY